MQTYLNLLSIKNSGKAIPYGGSGEIREDGDANYGFKLLKGNTEAVTEIPELKQDESLKDLIIAINLPETSLFSIGCTSGKVSDENGYRYSGYAEFAVNSREAIQDAAIYFPIFFHFNSLLHRTKFNAEVKFDWELMSAHFIEANVGGFTCTVFVNTAYLSSEIEAKDSWDAAMEILMSFLSSVKGIGGERIY